MTARFANPSLIELIQKASWSHTINFNYLTSKGEVKPYHVEVYEMKDSIFFGYDLAENKTKTFKYDMIYSASLGVPFTPRFERK